MKTTSFGIISMAFGIAIFFSSPTTSSCNDDILNSFVTIEGTVRTKEPETGKVSTPVGQSLIFQRIDCKKCLQVAVTDENGFYKLRVGEGKFRLIVPEDREKGGSSLDPGQPDIVNALNKLSSNTFDVKLIRHRNSLDTSIP